MTCIVGVVEDGKVYIGGDRAAVDGWKKNTSAHSKVYRVGPFLFGTCGSHRVAQVIEHEFKISVPQADTETDIHYLATIFANEIRSLLASRGIIGKSDDHEDKFEGGSLVGYRGNLYRLSSNFQIDHFERAFDGIGSGSPFALGALQILLKSRTGAWTAIRQALEVAEALCCDVAGPFDVECAS